MLDETRAISADTEKRGGFGQRQRVWAGVSLELAVTLILLLDLLSGAQRGNLRLHVAIETGAAFVAFYAATWRWLRCVPVMPRSPARRRPAASSPPEVATHVDGSVWRATTVSPMTLGGQRRS